MDSSSPKKQNKNAAKNKFDFSDGKLMNLYEQILIKIYENNGLKESRSQKDHLESLKPIAKGLWESYRSGDISTKYDETKVQEVYLLRYFVPYSFLLSDVLLFAQEINNINIETKGDLLNVCLFGGGPGPELVSLIRHIKEQEISKKSIKCTIIDIAAESWAYSRKIVRKAILNRMWDEKLIQIKPYTADLCVVDLLGSKEGLKERVKSGDLLIFQNCLNEANESQSEILGINIQQILSASKKGAITVVIEREGYPRTQKMLENLKTWAAEKDDFIVATTPNEPTERDCRSLHNTIPSDITDYLFTHRKHFVSILPKNEYGLTLERFTKYRWIVLKKVQ